VSKAVSKEERDMLWTMVGTQWENYHPVYWKAYTRAPKDILYELCTAAQCMGYRFASREDRDTAVAVLLGSLHHAVNWHHFRMVKN